MVLQQRQILQTLILLAVTFILSGCMTTKQGLNQYETAYKTGNYGECLRISNYFLCKSNENILRDKDLLWGLHAASAEKQLGNYPKSLQLFNQCESIMTRFDLENTTKIRTKQVGSLLWNDNAMNYRPERYDGIMVNTYKALGYLFENKINEARVECNRGLDRQRRAKEFFNTEIRHLKNQVEKEQKKEDERIQRQMKRATTRQQKRAIQNQRQDFSKVAENKDTNNRINQLYPSLNAYEVYPDFVNPFTTYLSGILAYSEGNYSKAESLFKETYGMVPESKYCKQDLEDVIKIQEKPGYSQQKLWVIFENGMGPIKDSFRIDLPVFLVSNDVLYTGIALPRLKKRTAAYRYIELYAEGNRYQSNIIGDIDRVVQSEFKKKYKWIVMRAVLSASIKTAMQYYAQKEMGYAGGISMALYQAFSTQADIRIWSALPKNFQSLSIPMPKNKEVIVSFPGGPEKKIIIPPCRNALIYVSAPGRQSIPVYRVIPFS